jgi:hypothetical protein
MEEPDRRPASIQKCPAAEDRAVGSKKRCLNTRSAGISATAFRTSLSEIASRQPPSWLCAALDRCGSSSAAGHALSRCSSSRRSRSPRGPRLDRHRDEAPPAQSRASCAARARFAARPTLSAFGVARASRYRVVAHAVRRPPTQDRSSESAAHGREARTARSFAFAR